MSDCKCTIKITSEFSNLKLLSDKLKQTSSLHLGNYRLIFDNNDDEQLWGSNWQIFSSIDFDSENNIILIDCISENLPAFGFWQKVSQDFSCLVRVDYFVEETEESKEWNEGVELNVVESQVSEYLSYWEHLYKFDNDYFWEDLELHCTYTPLVEMTKELGDVYYLFTQEELQKYTMIHTQNFREWIG